MRMGRLAVGLQEYRGSVAGGWFLRVRADIHLLKVLVLLHPEGWDKKYSPQKYHSICPQVYPSEET